MKGIKKNPINTFAARASTLDIDPSDFVIKTGRIIIPRLLRDPLFRGIKRFNKLYQPRQPIDPILRQKLQKEFVKEVEELRKILDHDLTHWTST